MLLPKVKLKSIVSFPASIIGGVGIETTKANGNLTVDLDYSQFGEISAIPTSPTSMVLTYDTASEAYIMLPSHLLGGAVAGIADAPNDGVLYGRQSAAWASVPITTDAPSDGNLYGRTNAAWAPFTLGGLADGSIPASKVYMQRATGATVLLSTRMRDLPFIEDWGGQGVPIGNTPIDNTAAFAAALADVGPGGTILLHHGLAYGASNIALRQGQRIIGWLNQGNDVFGAVPLANASAAIVYTGAAGGTLINFGAADAPTFTDTVGGGLENLQLYGANLAGNVLQCRACTTATFRNLKISYPRDGGHALDLTANPTTQGGSSVNNTVRSCSFENINIYCNGNSQGIFNASNGVEGGVTGSFFRNVMVQFGYSGSGNGIYLSSMDSSVWEGVYVVNGGSNTGIGIYLNGAGAGQQVQGNTFTMCVVAGYNPFIYYDGPTSRQNKMTLTGVDYLPTIQRGGTLSNSTFPTGTGAELYYEFLGTTVGNNPNLAGDKALSVVAPMRVRGYEVSDVNTLDWYEEGQVTPVVQFGGTNATLNASSKLRYTRIGNRVFFNANILLTAIGGGSGGMVITGLPYANADTNEVIVACSLDSMAAGVNGNGGAGVAASGSYMLVYSFGSASRGIISNSSCTANSRFVINGNYPCA